MTNFEGHYKLNRLQQKDKNCFLNKLMIFPQIQVRFEGMIHLLEIKILILHFLMLTRPIPNLSLENVHSPNTFLTQNSVKSSISSVFTSKTKLLSLVPRLSNLSQKTHSTIENKVHLVSSLRKVKSGRIYELNVQFQKDIIKPSDVNILNKLFVTLSNIQTRYMFDLKNRAYKILSLTNLTELPLTPIQQRTYCSVSSGDIVVENQKYILSRFENTVLIRMIEKKSKDFNTLILCQTLNKIFCQNQRVILDILKQQQDAIRIKSREICKVMKMIFDKKSRDDKQQLILIWKRQTRLNKTLIRFRIILENKLKIKYYQTILILLSASALKNFSPIKIVTQKSLESPPSCQLDSSGIDSSRNEISSKEKVAIQLASTTWMNYFIEKKILTQQHHFLSRIMHRENQLESHVSILLEPEIPMSPFEKALSTVSSHSNNSLKKITLAIPDDYSPANQLFARMNVPQRNSLKSASHATNKISQGTKQMVESLRRKNMPLLERVQSDDIVVSSQQCLSEEYISSKKRIQTQTGFEFLQVKVSPKVKTALRHREPSNLDIRMNKSDLLNSRIMKRLSGDQSKMLQSIRQYVQNTKDEKDNVIQFDNTKSQKKQQSLFLPSLKKNQWIVKDLKSPENDGLQKKSIDRDVKPGLIQDQTKKVLKNGFFQQSIQQVIQEALLQQKYQEIIVTHNKLNLLSTFLFILIVYVGFQYINDIQ